MLNYIRAKERIKYLNKSLHSPFRLALDTFEHSKCRCTELFYPEAYYMHKNNILILSLWNEDTCVSTITCNIRNSIASIHSKTHAAHTGKKYNLLLRSVVVMICGLIRENDKQISVVKSFSLNPVSEYTIKKYFDVVELKEYDFQLVCVNTNKHKSKVLFDDITSKL